MVNQYQEERSKDVYNILDMGRIMKMPFGGMTLLDYAINASLAISYVAMLKHDKAGLVTFCTQINSFIIAERRTHQMNHLMDTLYNQQTDFQESDYDLMYISVKRKIRQRSLLIVYSNFESIVSLNRQLPVLINLAKNHLLLVVLFKNTEIGQLVTSGINTAEDAYTKVIAEKLMQDKKYILKTLHRFGIHAILTEPENLTTVLLEKYLEIKAGEQI